MGADRKTKQQPKLKLVKSHEPSSKGFFLQEKATVDLFHLDNMLELIEQKCSELLKHNHFLPFRVGQKNIILQKHS